MSAASSSVSSVSDVNAAKSESPAAVGKSDNSSKVQTKTETNEQPITNGALPAVEMKNGSGNSSAFTEQAQATPMNGQEEKPRSETPHREVPGLLPLQPLTVTHSSPVALLHSPAGAITSPSTRQPPPPLLPMKSATSPTNAPVVATKSAPPPIPSATPPSPVKTREARVKSSAPATSTSDSKPTKEPKVAATSVPTSRSKRQTVEEATPPLEKEPKKRKSSLKKRHSIGSSDSTEKGDAESGDGDDNGRKSKRARTKTQPFQSSDMDPGLLRIIKATAAAAQQNKVNEDKLVVFFKGEFLAVRNAEGGFYICQAIQNINRGSHKIRIRWLSQVDKKDAKSKSKGHSSHDVEGEGKDESGFDVYTPDFYDYTDFECILTNLELEKLGKDRYGLPLEERQRTENILRRAIEVEQGVVGNLEVTEEHPDGLDVSLFHDESQLTRKRRGKDGRGDGSSSSDSEEKYDATSGSSGRSTEPEPTTSSSGGASTSAGASTSTGRGTKRTRAAAMAAARKKAQMVMIEYDDDETSDDEDDDVEDPDEEVTSSDSDGGKRRKRRASPRSRPAPTARPKPKSRQLAAKGKKSPPPKIAPSPPINKRTKGARKETFEVEKQSSVEPVTPPKAKKLTTKANKETDEKLSKVATKEVKEKTSPKVAEKKSEKEKPTAAATKVAVESDAKAKATDAKASNTELISSVEDKTQTSEAAVVAKEKDSTEAVSESMGKKDVKGKDEIEADAKANIKEESESKAAIEVKKMDSDISPCETSEANDAAHKPISPVTDAAASAVQTAAAVDTNSGPIQEKAAEGETSDTAENKPKEVLVEKKAVVSETTE